MTQVLKLTPPGEKKLVVLEGDKLVAYQDDAGVWTIGKGHTGPDVYKGKKISQQESNRLFEIDQPKYWKPVSKMLPNVPVPQNVLEGLFFFSYNIGAAGFLNSSAAAYFKRMTVFNRDTITQLGVRMKMYNKVTVNGKKVVSKGLVNRRAQEVAWMLGASTAPVTTKQKVAAVAAIGGGAVGVVDQSGNLPTVDNTGTLQSIVDNVGVFGMSGSTVLATIGSLVVIGVLGYIMYKKFFPPVAADGTEAGE